MEPLLSCDFSVSYPSTGAGVRGVRFDVRAGEIFGIAGESGSGKSTVALALAALTSRRGGTASGSVRFRGRNLFELNEKDLRTIRGREIGWVSQSSGSALNPAISIGTHFREAWRAHRSNGLWEDAARPLLETLRIPATREFYALHSRELSIGMAQRVLIALGLLHGPSLLIADEPTSALDLATQTELLTLFRKLRAERDLSIIFISHDLLGLMSVCDRIAVLRAGELVEVMEASGFLDSGTHPYTRELANALRDLLPDPTGSTGNRRTGGP